MATKKKTKKRPRKRPKKAVPRIRRKIPEDLTFRELIDEVRDRGTKPPVQVDAIADRCGISKGYLQNLAAGRRTGATRWTVQRIAAGLGVSEDTVRNALSRTATQVSRRERDAARRSRRAG